MDEGGWKSRRDSEERTAVGMTKVFEKPGVTGCQGTGTETVRHDDQKERSWGVEMRMVVEGREGVRDKVNRLRAMGV